MPTNSDFAKPLLSFLEETFETHNGIYLDKGDSLLPTLDRISAGQASIPGGGTCASLAAQVAHTIFYIEAWERFVLQGDNSPRDWGYIWRTVEKVTPEEWNKLKTDLRAAYQRMDQLFRKNDTWNADTMGGALSIVVHTAYHLGQIRQSLCILR